MSPSKEACIQIAIAVYNSQKIKSKRRAAAVYNVPETIFYEGLSEIKLCNKTCANSHRLFEFKEETLIQHLLDVDK